MALLFALYVASGRRSAAELSAVEKNKVSHRAQAVRALVAALESASVYSRP